MSTSITRRGVTIGAAAIIALLVTLAVASQATAATYYACVKKNGSAHIYTKKPRCKRGESKLSWNTVGPAGARGLNGKNGNNGANGTNGTNGTNATLGSLTWHGFSLENGWKAYPFTYASEPRFTKDSLGFVHLSGTLEGPGTSNLFATLPAGFRPTTEHAWVSVASTNSGFDPRLVNLDIANDGTIRVYYGTEAKGFFVSLEGVTFFAG
jgi:hypothetical protein